jgi:hypothetical protein
MVNQRHGDGQSIEKKIATKIDSHNKEKRLFWIHCGIMLISTNRIKYQSLVVRGGRKGCKSIIMGGTSIW